MSVHIYPVKTGYVKIKKSQKIRKPGGMLRVLTDPEWTDWLPIYSWLIEHPEGIFIVDTGDTSRTTTDPHYFPGWHPYYRNSVKMDIRPEEEIGPQLKQMGIKSNDIHKVILTHFHTDHAGGLHHFNTSQVLVSGKDYKLARGLIGRLSGYLPHRWPKNFNPLPVIYVDEPIGPFKKSYPVTGAGDITIVPTPGHTPYHQSVIVKIDDLLYFLAGDTSYSQQILMDNQADGVSLNAGKTLATMQRIRELAELYPMVYLPSHDPESERRLTSKEVMKSISSIPKVEQQVMHQ